jgi:DNA-binding CsgD family transcriptional regulator
MWLWLLTYAGEFAQARRHGEKWVTQVPAPLRGRFAMLRSRVEPDVEQLCQLLVTAVDELAGHDPLRAAFAYAEASVVLGFQLGRLEAARSFAAAAIPHARAAGYPPLLRGGLAADGLLAVLAGETGAGEQLRAAARLPGFEDSPVPYYSPEAALACLHLWRGESDPARQLMHTVRSLAERIGASECVFQSNIILAGIEWRAGDWAEAAALAAVAARWNRESWRGRDGALGFVQSLVKAGYGAVADARKLAADGLRASEAQRDWAFAAQCRWVLGQVELSLDDPVAALRWLDPVSDMLQAGGIGEPGCHAFTPDLIEAWAATGQLAAATERLCWLQDAARRLDHPWARIAAGRAAAVVRLAERDPAGAVEAVARVVPEARERRLPYELGRCLLVLGTAQRKARQRREAAASLDAAITTFRGLGAARWQDLAVAQRARLTAGQDDELTPTERRIAELVANGHSNPEIAASLFISVKTVEANLTRMYRKLGIRGRVELARRDPG